MFSPQEQMKIMLLLFLKIKRHRKDIQILKCNGIECEDLSLVDSMGIQIGNELEYWDNCGGNQRVHWRVWY